jgi:alanine racemase
MTSPKQGFGDHHSDDAGASSAASLLRINLGAVAENYQILKSRLSEIACAAVVKADAYGLGVAQVAPILAAEGCSTFFVATIDEGIALRRCLAPEAIEIAVLNGVLAGTEEAFHEHRLMPVVNDLGQIARWHAMCERTGIALQAMLHVDTGMNRLGLSPSELDWLAQNPQAMVRPTWRCLISHLASADDPDNPSNAEQLARFRIARSRLPRMPASLSNSGGVFLGPDYHFDLARPGIALYGGHPCGGGFRAGPPNPMRQTVQVLGRILQIRDVEPGMAVGYGGDHRISGKGRVATVAAGYADGYLRSSGGQAHVYLGHTRLPVIGRVSMDLITVDVTSVSQGEARPGAFVEILGDQVTPDNAGQAAGTISYEFLTRLGNRYHRRYVHNG